MAGLNYRPQRKGFNMMHACVRTYYSPCYVYTSIEFIHLLVVSSFICLDPSHVSQSMKEQKIKQL